MSRPLKYTKEVLEEAASSSVSVAQVLRRLGLKQSGGMNAHIKKRLISYGVDISHFLGKAANTGKKYGAWRPIQDYLVSSGPFITSHKLKLRLIVEGIKEHACEICATRSWCGKLIPIELDHINGERGDNRLSNLRIVCPNCHAQTNTYCNKKRN
jgi:5-methylcytosine-specific restriction endonuclease McrA